MIEERIFLILGYVAISALLLIFLLYSSFSSKLKTLIPQTEIVTGAGHAPDQLLNRLAKIIRY